MNDNEKTKCWLMAAIHDPDLLKNELTTFLETLSTNKLIIFLEAEGVEYEAEGVEYEATNYHPAIKRVYFAYGSPSRFYTFTFWENVSKDEKRNNKLVNIISRLTN